ARVRSDYIDHGGKPCGLNHIETARVRYVTYDAVEGADDVRGPELRGCGLLGGAQGAVGRADLLQVGEGVYPLAARQFGRRLREDDAYHERRAALRKVRIRGRAEEHSPEFPRVAVFGFRGDSRPPWKFKSEITLTDRSKLDDAASHRDGDGL